MIILKFIFFIFLIGVGAVLFFFLRVYLTVRKLKKRGGFHNDGGFRTDGTSSQHTTSTTGESGERITDTRSPSHGQRKIIADDEGEYVDFEEVEE